MKSGFLSFFFVIASVTTASAQASAVFMGPTEAPPAMRQAAERGVTQALVRANVELKPTDRECSNGDAACLARTLQATSTEAAIFYAVFPPSPIRAEGLVLVQFHDGANNLSTGRFVFADIASLTGAAAEATLLALSGWPERHGAPGRIAVEGTPPGATVHVDGRPVGTVPHEEEASPGAHTVRVFSQGRQDFEQQVEVTSGETAVVRVQLVRGNDTGEVVGDPDPIITPPRPAERGSALPSYLLGGGLVLAGAALLVPGFYALANDGECADTPCRGDAGRVVWKTDFDGGDAVLIGAGAVLILGGAVLLAARPWRLAPSASPHSFRLDLEAHF